MLGMKTPLSRAGERGCGRGVGGEVINKSPAARRGRCQKVERSKPALRVSGTFLKTRGKKCKFFFTYEGGSGVKYGCMTLRPSRIGLGEARLLRKGDIKQAWEDLKDFHVRADGFLPTVGSFVMAPIVFASKAGNAIVGEFSPNEAEPLGEGGLKYISRDVRSAAGNLLGAVKNLNPLDFHPIRAVGNVAKAGFDGLDIVVTDPLIDLGSGAFGHQNRKTRSAISETLAA